MRIIQATQMVINDITILRPTIVSKWNARGPMVLNVVLGTMKCKYICMPDTPITDCSV